MMEKQRTLLKNNTIFMNILIKNGRVVDPANNRDEICDVLIREGKISEI